VDASERRTHGSPEVARVGTADIAVVVPLMEDYCRFYAAEPGRTALERISRACVDDPVRTGFQLLARSSSRRPLGFATVYWTWATTSGGQVAVMNDLFVAAQARGQGVGYALLKACAVEVAARGLSRMTWQTAPANTSAQALYDRVGATVESWYEYTLDVGAP